MRDLATGVVHGKGSEDARGPHRTCRVPQRVGLTGAGEFKRAVREGRRRVGLGGRIVVRRGDWPGTAREPLCRADPTRNPLPERCFRVPHAAEDKADPQSAAEERSAKREILVGTTTSHDGRSTEHASTFEDLAGASFINVHNVKGPGTCPREGARRTMANRNRERARTTRDEDAIEGNAIALQHVAEALPVVASRADHVDDSGSAVGHLGSTVIPNDRWTASQRVNHRPRETAAVRPEEQVRDPREAASLTRRVSPVVADVDERQPSISRLGPVDEASRGLPTEAAA